MSERLACKLLIVGWDAADWRIIDQLFAHKAMPTLQRLVESGARANLASLEPRLSPLLWTTIATGKTADKHGILNFVEPDADSRSVRISSSTTRKTKALWNIFTQAGLRTNVVNWYASHPAEPINGVCASNLFQEGAPAALNGSWPLPAGAVHPAMLSDRIAELRVHPAEIRADELVALVPNLAKTGRDDPRPAELARHLARCSSVHNAATALMADDAGWDCTMVFYDTIDTIGHHFMQYHPPRMAHVSEPDFDLYRHVMFGVYQLQDMMLAALLQLAGSDTTVMLLSDHGFQSGGQRPVILGTRPEDRAAAEASWHRAFGILAMSGPGIRAGQRIYGSNLLDIAPTALTLMGVAVGADMDGRVLSEAFDKPVTVDRVFSWDAMEGSAGTHTPDLRQDPFEAQSAIDQLVDLGYLEKMPENTQVRLAMVSRETRFNLGVVYMTTRRAQEAAPIFEQLLKEFPGERRFAVGLARCRFAQGEFDACRSLLELFLERNPRHADARIILAATLVSLGDFERAATVLAETEALVAVHPELAGALGETYARMKRWADAERLFKRAVETDPENARAMHGLGLAALAQERFEEAAGHCLDAVGLLHFFPEAHHTLAVALTWMGDYQHAIASFRVVLSMQPGSIEAHRFLATIHRHLRDGADASRHRQLAEDLIRRRRDGQDTSSDAMREPPMGPQEWARHMGSPQETDDVPEV